MSNSEKTREVLEKIKLLRKFREYSQDYMGGKMDISQKSYSLLENGQTNMSLEYLNKISEILGFKPDDLMRLSISELLKNDQDGKEDQLSA